MGLIENIKERMPSENELATMFGTTNPQNLQSVDYFSGDDNAWTFKRYFLPSPEWVPGMPILEGTGLNPKSFNRRVLYDLRKFGSRNEAHAWIYDNLLNANWPKYVTAEVPAIKSYNTNDFFTIVSKHPQISVHLDNIDNTGYYPGLIPTISGQLCMCARGSEGYIVAERYTDPSKFIDVYCNLIDVIQSNEFVAVTIDVFCGATGDNTHCYDVGGTGAGATFSFWRADYLFEEGYENAYSEPIDPIVPPPPPPPDLGGLSLKKVFLGIALVVGGAVGYNKIKNH